MHDFKDELWIRFLDLDFTKFIVKNAGFTKIRTPNNVGGGGAKEGFEGCNSIIFILK